METDNISIRKAQLADVDDLFWLLHSEGFFRKREQVRTEIDDIFVMTCRDILIGATCRNKGVMAGFRWTAVHPMYPEKALSRILHDSLTNVRLHSSYFELAPCKT